MVSFALCECTWGLGVPLPPHLHLKLSLVTAYHLKEGVWINNFIPQAGYEVQVTVEEISISVPWKDLARQEAHHG